VLPAKLVGSSQLIWFHFYLCSSADQDRFSDEKTFKNRIFLSPRLVTVD
jgi:hypothetical protein